MILTFHYRVSCHIWSCNRVRVCVCRCVCVGVCVSVCVCVGVCWGINLCCNVCNISKMFQCTHTKKNTRDCGKIVHTVGT